MISLISNIQSKSIELRKTTPQMENALKRRFRFLKSASISQFNEDDENFHPKRKIRKCSKPKSLKESDNLNVPHKPSDPDSSKLEIECISFEDFSELVSSEDNSSKNTLLEDSLSKQTIKKEDNLEIFKQPSVEIVDDNDVDFYLNNFKIIIETIKSNQLDWKLFDGYDAECINKFQTLSTSCQQLYIRLYLRKHIWLLVDKIKYPYISDDLSPFLETLYQNGFLDCSVCDRSDGLSIPEILDILPLAKAKIFSKYLNIKYTSKPQLIRFVLNLCKNKNNAFFINKKNNIEDKIKGKLNNLLDKCYKISIEPKKVFGRCMLVFDVSRGIEPEGNYSSNSRGPNQLSSMILAGMRKVKYPTYKVNVTRPLFQSRNELLGYEKACNILLKVQEEFDNSRYSHALSLCKSSEEFSSTIDRTTIKSHKQLPRFMQRYTSSYICRKIKSLKFESLQKLKKYEAACEVLSELLADNMSSSKRGCWYERLSLNLEHHLKDPIKAIKVIGNALKDKSLHSAHYLSLNERLDRLRTVNKKCSTVLIDGKQETVRQASVINISGRYLPKRFQTSKARFMKTIESSEDVILCSVEELALDHYKEEGFSKGRHGESSTFFSLYTLLMWDIIFDSVVPDVFRNNLQSSPLDFLTKDFYLSRRSAIDNRLEDIRCWVSKRFDCNKHIRKVWSDNLNSSCSFMNWELFNSSEEVIELALCIGGGILAKIFKRISLDPGGNKSGMPDLVVWNVADKRFKIVEVKGPGDKLFAKQKVWIHYLLSVGVNVELCNVIASASRKL